jgi:hypothetical protein
LNTYAARTAAPVPVSVLDAVYVPTVWFWHTATYAESASSGSSIEFTRLQLLGILKDDGLTPDAPIITTKDPDFETVYVRLSAVAELAAAVYAV